METIVSVEVDGKKIELYQSEGDSRDWDNYTKLICFHGRYNLGDKHEYNHNDYDGWDEMEQAILRKEKDVVWISPLYLYDHSGITISTSPFSCPWDSGQVGFAIVTKRDIRKLQGCKRVTKDIIAKVGDWAESEIKTKNYVVKYMDSALRIQMVKLRIVVVGSMVQTLMRMVWVIILNKNRLTH